LNPLDDLLIAIRTMGAVLQPHDVPFDIHVESERRSHTFNGLLYLVCDLVGRVDRANLDRDMTRPDRSVRVKLKDDGDVDPIPQ
jgi:hypothetical protein